MKTWKIVALTLGAFGAVFAGMLLENDAHARDSSYVGWLEVRSAFGTGAGCTTAIGAGSGCFEQDVETQDDLDVGDDATIRGDFIITGTAATGAVIAGANTACNTTCVHSCLFGVNTAATEADIVACTDATADECVCLGPT